MRAGRPLLRSSLYALTLVLAAGALTLPPLLAASPALAATEAATPQPGFFHPTTFTLANGLQVVVIENHRAPVVSHMVWYKVGAADDPVGKSGLAHYLEHLMFKGTKEVKSGEFSATVARNGGDENAFTTEDYTAFYQNVSADRLALVMRLEADRMQNLSIPGEEAIPELKVVLNERRQRIDASPGALLREVADGALFLHHPYGTPTIGWPDEVAGLTVEDARAFYKRWYAPNNAILIVYGDVTPDEVRTLAGKYYGPVPRRDVPERKRLAEPVVEAPRRVEREDPRVTLTSLSRTYLAPSHTTSPAWIKDGVKLDPPLQVLSEIMGGGTGRLYRALVIDQHIATSAGFYYSETKLDLGTLGVYVVAAPDTDIADAEKALDAELGKLLKDGVSDEEVERAKRHLIDQSVYAADSVQGPARLFGETLASGGTIDEVENWPSDIAAVTATQVNEAARAVLDKNHSVTAILAPKPGAAPQMPTAGDVAPEESLR